MSSNAGSVVLFLGGARSGKSRLALALAEGLSGERVYIATAEALDAEMAERIARHQADRGSHWRTLEVPLALPETIRREGVAGRVLLVDCLTLWLTNLMLHEHDIDDATAQLLSALEQQRGTVLLVSNEVGLGIVPENALARRFRDEAGRLHQRVAAMANEVMFVAAGLQLRMK